MRSMPTTESSKPLMAGLTAEHADLLELVPVAEALAVEEVREVLADRQ